MNHLKNSIIISIMAVITFIFSSSAMAAQIRLVWHAPTKNADGTRLTDLEGYKIYYGTSSGEYGTSIDVGNVTSYDVTDLTSGTLYFFAVTAYNAFMNESSYSNEVSVIAGNTVQITVATNPTGRQMAVDSISYTAPQTFTWVVGSLYTLSVSSPQAETGVLYSFSSWSDSGGVSHSITVPATDTTYTAHFTTHYILTTSVTPFEGGSVTPSGTNWYDSGQSAFLSASSNTGYTFSGWSGDLSGTTNPTFLVMNGPMNVTANFTCSYSISPNTASFDSSGGIGTVSVNGVNGCSWTAKSNVSWIAISSPGSGNGNGGVSYSVSANKRPKSRTGTITIAGQVLTVNQSSKNQ